MAKSNWKKRLDEAEMYPPLGVMPDTFPGSRPVEDNEWRVAELAQQLMVAYINKNGRLAPDVTRELLACAKEAGEILGWTKKILPPTEEQLAEVDEAIQPL